MAFTHDIGARLPLVPLTRGSLTTLQASLDAADRPVATSIMRCRHSASTAGLSPDAGSQLPRTLASPRTGLAPVGCRELVARLRHVPPFGEIRAPELLDAHVMKKRCAASA